MNTSIEERKAMFELALKKVLYGFHVVGPIMEVMFEYRGKVKQERLLRFVELLEAGFIRKEIDLKKLQTEGASDLFESIFRKVTETRAEQKRIGFKNLLLRGIRNEEQIEYCEIFSEVLLGLKEIQLEILTEHAGRGVLQTRNKLIDQLDTLEKENIVSPEEHSPLSLSTFHNIQKELAVKIDSAKDLLDKYLGNCNAERFKMSPAEYRYFIQDLISKGLLQDDGVGAIGTKACEVVSITDFGMKFLSFIEDTNDQKQAD